MPAAPALPAASGTRKLTTAVGGVVGDALPGGGVDRREPRGGAVPSPSSLCTLYCRPLAACARAATRGGGGVADSPLPLQKETVARVSIRRTSTSTLLRLLCISSFALFRQEPMGDSSDSSQDEERCDELSLGGDGAADTGAEDEAEEEVEAEEEESDDENAPAGSEKITARAKRALRELDDAWAPRSVPADALEKAAGALGVPLERATTFCKRHHSAMAKCGSGNAAVGVVAPCCARRCAYASSAQSHGWCARACEDFTCALVADPTYHGCNAAAEADGERRTAGNK